LNIDFDRVIPFLIMWGFPLFFMVRAYVKMDTNDRSDVKKYRTREEEVEWKKKDGIKRFCLTSSHYWVTISKRFLGPYRPFFNESRNYLLRQ